MKEFENCESRRKTLEDRTASYEALNKMRLARAAGYQAKIKLNEQMEKREEMEERMERMETEEGEQGWRR